MIKERRGEQPALLIGRKDFLCVPGLLTLQLVTDSSAQVRLIVHEDGRIVGETDRRCSQLRYE